jgi:hypothetical protein
MKQIALMTRQNCTCWIFLFSVLTGLFFSSGEGIQLFPFPIVEGNNSKNNFSIIEKNLKSYAFSVHNSGNHSSLIKSKFQKQINKYLAGGDLIFDWSNPYVTLCLQTRRYRVEASLLYASVFLSSQSDRAPPFV